MTPLTCTIEPDELLGLSALVELDRAAAGTGTSTGTGTGTGAGVGAVHTAKALMRTALADKLEQAACHGLRPRKQPASAPPRPPRQLAPYAGSRETARCAKPPRGWQLPL